MSATDKMYTKESRQTKQHIHTCMFCDQSGTNLSDCDSERLREVLRLARTCLVTVGPDKVERTSWLGVVTQIDAALSDQKG